MNDGHPMPFDALLGVMMDVQYVIFYSLSMGSRLWTCAKPHHDGHSISSFLLITGR